MDRIIDVSLPLDSNTPTWPDSPGIRLHWYKRLAEGDGCNNTQLDCDTHVGTHLDAPLHFVENGASVDQVSLEILVGPALVIHLPDVAVVTAGDLEALDRTANIERLLLRTRNSQLWAANVTEFKKDYVALTPEAAQWIVDRRIGLIGIDYLSVGSYEDGAVTHRILLEAGVVVLEGLNLHDVSPGEYELICLPLKLIGAEGALARAILRVGSKSEPSS